MTVLSNSTRLHNVTENGVSWQTGKQSPIDHQATSCNPTSHSVNIDSLTQTAHHDRQNFIPPVQSEPVERHSNLGLEIDAIENHHNSSVSPSLAEINTKKLLHCFCLSCLSMRKSIRPSCSRLTGQFRGCFLQSNHPRCDCLLLRRLRRHVANENLLVLNLIQLLCGLSAIILTSVAMTKTVFLYQMGTGMWAGLIMLVTGTQGLLAARRPMFCTLIGLLIMCLVASIAACCLIGVSVAGTIEDGFLDRSRRYPSPLLSTSPDVLKFTYTFTPADVDRFGRYSYSSNDSHTTLLNLHLHNVGNEFEAADAQSLSDSYLRTYRVILHVLLLLVGILESSIGLSTVVLCCRYICSRSSRRRQPSSSLNGGLVETRILSFDANTATQAANLLQSGYMNRLAGAGNVLLAVGTDTLMEHDQHFLQAMHNTNSAVLKPHIHDTVHSFLPESVSSSALILTQAGTGALAWTAARAAAFVVCGSNPVGDDDSSSLQTESLPAVSTNATPQGRSSQQPPPRLLFTPVSTPSNLPSTVQTDCYDVSASCPPGSTFLYVMPSPSGVEPPLIFPPFPPIYSELQRRPCLPSIYRPTTDMNSIQNSPSNSRQTTSDQRGTRSDRRSSTNSRLRIVRSFHSGRRLMMRLRQSVRPLRARSNMHVRPSPTSLMCAIDRILQPVVIVGSPNSSVPSCTDPIFTDSPPAYSVIQETSQVGLFG